MCLAQTMSFDKCYVLSVLLSLEVGLFPDSIIMPFKYICLKSVGVCQKLGIQGNIRLF